MMYWIGYDGLSSNQGKANALGQSRKQQLALHHGKVHADADARARAEWHIGITGKLFLSLWSEAFVIKFLRFREVLLSTVQRVRSEQNKPTFRNVVAIDLDLPQSTSGCQIYRRVESHRFLENLQTIG